MMPDLTQNIGLKKPLDNETADISVINNNMDTIDAEITKKASSTEDGRMSKEDKDKLDGIETNANNYQHPSTHSLDIITETSTKKVMTDVERVKLAAIEECANNYVHPTTHPASIIIEDSTHRFVSDTEKDMWNGKTEQIWSAQITSILGV